MKELLKIKTTIANNPWLITQECFLSFIEALEYCVEISDDISDDVGAYENNGVGVLPIHGTIMRNVDPKVAKFFGISDTITIQEQIQNYLDDSKITHILLDVDSGGGSVTGVQETAEMIAMADKEKPVYAVCEGMMASAAYWMGSQARAIIASKSSKIGSIGVYLPVFDSSEMYKSQGIQVELIKNKEATYKGAGFDGTSLTDEQRNNLQEMVQEIYTEFSTSVKSARPSISKEAMQGQVFLGSRAKGMGLVDLVGSYGDAINLLVNEK